MPKGTKHMDVRGAEYHWFECGCGHRWEGASQRAKDLAYRLHRKHCNTGPLQNHTLGHRNPRAQSEAGFIDESLVAIKHNVQPRAEWICNPL